MRRGKKSAHRLPVLLTRSVLHILSPDIYFKYCTVQNHSLSYSNSRLTSVLFSTCFTECPQPGRGYPSFEMMRHRTSYVYIILSFECFAYYVTIENYFSMHPGINVNLLKYLRSPIVMYASVMNLSVRGSAKKLWIPVKNRVYVIASDGSLK